MNQQDRFNEAQSAWSDYNDRQKFEHELLDRKITWLLTSQTILFAAYGVSFGGEGGGRETFRNIVAATGVSIATIVFMEQSRCSARNVCHGNRTRDSSVTQPDHRPVC